MDAGSPALLLVHVAPPSVDFRTRATCSEQKKAHHVAAYSVSGFVGERSTSVTGP